MVTLRLGLLPKDSPTPPRHLPHDRGPYVPFNAAVRTKIEAGGPQCEIRAGALVESLQLTLRLTTAFADDRAGPQVDTTPPRRLHLTTSAQASVPAPPRRMLDSDLHQRLRVKAASAPTEGKYKNSTVYEAYLDGNYAGTGSLTTSMSAAARACATLSRPLWRSPTSSTAMASCLTKPPTAAPSTWRSRPAGGRWFRPWT